MEPVRIGFVGVGSMGECAHLRNYHTLPDCTIAAIAEIKPQLGGLVGERYGIASVYTDPRAMLEHEALDAVICIQPFTRHGVLLPSLYDRDLPVLTEKPLGRSLDVGEALVKKLAETKAKHYVAYHKRSDPATMHVKQVMAGLADSNELGSLRYIRVTMPAGDWIASGFLEMITTDEPVPHLEGDAPAGDMDEPTERAYTSFVNFYIHQVNLIRHLLGEDYSVDFADPGGVLLTGTSESGVTVVLEMSPYSTTIDWQEQAVVCYERGWIRLDLPAPLASNRAGRVTVMRDPSRETTPVIVEPQMPWVHAMRQQAINFIAAVRGDDTPLCLADEALKDLYVARDYIRKARGQ